MHRHMLSIYMNDHLAVATSGVVLARHLARRHRRTPHGPDLKRIAGEIAEDRRILLRIMDGAGVPIRRRKIYAGWAAERARRARRVKPSGVLHRSTGLDAVEELETLRLGVEGKTLLWQTLLVLAPGNARLDEAQLRDLLVRARNQVETLETLRRTAAANAFTQGCRPARMS